VRLRVVCVERAPSPAAFLSGYVDVSYLDVPCMARTLLVWSGRALARCSLSDYVDVPCAAFSRSYRPLVFNILGFNPRRIYILPRKTR